MNLFELFVKIGVKDEASSKLSGITSALGSGLKAAASVGVAAISVAASGIAALTTAAVKNYAEYEQLVGGAKLLYGDAYDYIETRASEAYKNVQMSQNEYLTQVNGFATGLKTALNGNEQAAAELADRIITAEADIVAATGATQEAVQNAFNGIMKSNYTMLDNLQLGITPTKEGFQTMIDTVNEWNKANGEATNYQINNLADAQSALLDYIEMQGLAGYAAAEATGTISGSVASLKAAWQNLVTGVADDTADFEGLVSDFVESVGTAAGNVLPRVTTALNGAAQLITALLPTVIEAIPQLISEVLPQMATAAVNIVHALMNGISESSGTLITSAMEIIGILITGIVSLLPEIIVAGVQLIVALAQGLAESAPTLIPTIIDAVLLMVDTLIENAPLLLTAGVQLIAGLLQGLVSAIPTVVSWVLSVPKKIADAIIKGAPALFDAGKNLIEKLAAGFDVAWNSFIILVAGAVNQLINYINSIISAVGGLFGITDTISIPTLDTSKAESNVDRAMGILNGTGSTTNITINAVQQTPAQITRTATDIMQTARW